MVNVTKVTSASGFLCDKPKFCRGAVSLIDNIHGGEIRNEAYVDSTAALAILNPAAPRINGASGRGRAALGAIIGPEHHG